MLSFLFNPIKYIHGRIADKWKSLYDAAEEKKNTNGSERSNSKIHGTPPLEEQSEFDA